MKIRRIVLGLLVIFMMLVIFIFSSQSGGQSGGLSEKIAVNLINFFNPSFQTYSAVDQAKILDSFEFVIRKMAHMAEYGLLAGLIFLFFFGIRLSYRVTFSLVITLLYSISDEIHQHFIPGRTGVYTDVLIDMTGAICIICILSIITHFYDKHKKQKIKIEQKNSEKN